MITVTLPTLHPGQVEAFLCHDRARFKVVRCGRRWGKTDFAKTLACDAATKGRNVGWFTPDYKIQSEAFQEVVDILEPIKRSSSKVEGRITTITKGRLDFWTLENERAGRSRKYHLAIIDEAAFTKPNMMKIWETAIKPALLDFRGSAVILSTPNGIDQNNFFYNICTDAKYEFKEYHAPTHTNPHIPARWAGESDQDYMLRRGAEFASIQANNHPLVYRQEYLAEFVDWSGVQFFDLQKMLVDGQPVTFPTRCDGVFATIDTAVKAGREHDGTAVVYWAISKYTGHPLTVLDWDIVQIEGSLLEAWLPNVFMRLDELALQCSARTGSLGAYIEDKGSGMVLLQQAARHGWPATAIDSKLTSVGKDERAISISGYHYSGKVKLSQHAFDKTQAYHEKTRNHFLTQIMGFRIGDKDLSREDDLLDCYSYGVAIALGNATGF